MPENCVPSRGLRSGNEPRFRKSRYVEPSAPAARTSREHVIARQTKKAAISVVSVSRYRPMIHDRAWLIGL